MPLTPVTWLNALTVNTTTAGTQNEPEIAQLANGNILVTWTSYSDTGVGSPDGADVLGQLFDPMGTKIGAEFIINAASTAEDERDSDIVTLPGGGFIVIYHADDFQAVGGSNIMLEEFSASGAPVSESAIVVLDTGLGAFPNYANPRGAAASATSVLIVYEKSTAFGASGISGKIYNPATNTYSSEITVISGEGNISPEVTVLSNGNYAIVANRADTGGGGDNALIMRVLSPTGADVMSQTIVAGTDSNGANDTEVSVTSLTGGGFVVAWSSVDGADTDIGYTVYSNAGVVVGSGVAGSTSGANDNNEPAVAALADGSFVIVYDDDVNDTVHATHFSAAGVSLGDFVFATLGTEMAVTGLGDGRFAVTYLSEGGEIQMEIMDTRDAANTGGVYTPGQWQVGTVGNDLFTAAANVATIHGHTGNDTITDGTGANTIFGDAGNDRINVVGVVDTDAYYGGIGTDTIDWSGNTAGSGIVFNLALGTAVLGAVTEVMNGFEHLTGTSRSDRITGNTSANSLTGGAGNDTIDGGAGNDTLDGGTGNDSLTGGTGTDTVSGGDGNDIVTILAAGSHSTQGGAGLDLLNMSALTVSVTLDLVSGLSNVAGSHLGYETVTMGSGNDIVTGTGINETLNGGAGNDSLNGGAGNDSLTGGTGNDTLFGGTGTDRLFGDTGNDTLQGSDGNDRLDGGAGNDVLTGGLGNDRYIVGESGDTVTGEIGFSLGGGIDTVESYVDFTLPSNVEILRLMGSANINGTGSSGPDALVGNIGANILTGGFGNDQINGKSGNDRIIGGAGADTLVGEAGADTFVYLAATDSGVGAAARDFINGFEHGIDLIDLSGIDANAVGGGANDAFVFVTTAFTGVAGQLRAANFGSNYCIVEADRDGNGTADMQIFVNLTTFMVGTDFIL